MVIFYLSRSSLYMGMRTPVEVIKEVARHPIRSLGTALPVVVVAIIGANAGGDGTPADKARGAGEDFRSTIEYVSPNGEVAVDLVVGGIALTATGTAAASEFAKGFVAEE
jgi:hypothetical protein